LGGTFIEGLRSKIRREVKVQRPRTITAAFSNAKVQEERLSEEKHKTTKVVSKMSSGSTGAPNLSRKPSTTRLTQKELKQLIDKGFVGIVMRNGTEDTNASKENC
jgi:predicted pyridoxine 5'-phosphate oxidase superfamily flavin-nucleotide-binding protein